LAGESRAETTETWTSASVFDAISERFSSTVEELAFVEAQLSKEPITKR
jgi:hypothetical protein